MSERGHTRGQFLGAGAALSAGALASTWRQPSEAAAQTTQPVPLAAGDGSVTEGAFHPNFVGESFFLEVDGADAGFVTDVRGGYPQGQTIEVTNGKKHVANIKFNEVSFKFAMTQPGGLFDWVRGTLDGSAPRRSGSIKAVDADFRVAQQAFFDDAIITEIGFPALDVTVREPAYMSLTFAADTRLERGGGTVPSGGVKPQDASFKLTVGDLSTRAPAKIDAFTIKQSFAESGGVKTPVKLSIPEIYVSLARNSGLASWVGFYEDFLLQQNFSDGDELQGSLDVTNSKGTKTLANVSFFHMGILSAVPVVEQVAGESVPRVKAEMYCEDIRFTSGSG